MTAFPLILAQLNDTLEAIRDQFRRGGSFTALLIIAAVILVALCTVYVLTRRQYRAAHPLRTIDPEGVFRRALQGLPLTAGQRRMLMTLASDLQIAHPTVVLLSPSELSRCARSWRERHPGHVGDDAALERLLHEVAPVLFPSAPPSRTRNPSMAGAGVPPTSAGSDAP